MEDGSCYLLVGCPKLAIVLVGHMYVTEDVSICLAVGCIDYWHSCVTEDGPILLTGSMSKT